MDSTQYSQLRVSHPAKGNEMGRGLKLSLDGEDIGHLKAGSSFVVNIEVGPHQLRADNTYRAKTVGFNLCGSNSPQLAALRCVGEPVHPQEP